MPIFDYTTSDRSGSLTHGQIEAKNRNTASKQLLSRGLFILELKPGRAPEPVPLNSNFTPPSPSRTKPNRELSQTSKNTIYRSNTAAPPAELGQKNAKTEAPRKPSWLEMANLRPRLSAVQKAIYLRQLQVMFDAGIPIYKASSLLAEGENYKPELQSILAKIPRDLERGRPLSKSLERTNLFGRVVTASLRLGEESGRLSEVLRSLAKTEESSVKLKKILISRLTYPAVVLFVMCFGLLILGHVMSRVIASMPNFDPQTIPLLGLVTRCFQHSGFLPLLLLLFISLAAMMHRVLIIPENRLAFESSFINVPVLGSLIKRVEANIVTAQLSLLVRSGLPIDKGLSLCADLVGTVTFHRALLKSQEELRAGSELGESFREAKLFPEDVLALIVAGELSGKLESSLERASGYCEEQVERSLETAMSLLEPLMIGVLGISIAAVILCTFAPIFNSLQTL